MPRRGVEGVDDLIDPLSEFLKHPGHVCRPLRPDDPDDRGCANGAVRLNSFQAQGLAEFHDTGRLWVNGPLGIGKSILSFLAFTLLEAKRPLLVIPGGGRSETLKGLEIAREHWRIPSFQIGSYQKIARPGNENFFWEPPGPYDVVIFDEIQNCRNEDTAVTRRFERLRDNAGLVIVVGDREIHVPANWRTGVMSATHAKDSVVDFAHTMVWTHGKEGAPIPTSESELNDWASAIDANPRERIAPGALTIFSNGNDSLEEVRKGIARRIFETPGVISSDKSYVDAKLEIVLRDVPLGGPEDEHFKVLRGDPDDHEDFPGWRDPGGDIIADPMEMWRVACSLALGFWTYWDPQPPDGWYQARKAWHAGVRAVLQASRTLDTVAQVANAVDRGEIPDLVEDLAAWREAEPTFKQCNNVNCTLDHRKIVDGREVNKYHSLAEWVGDSALCYAQDWVKEGGIVWTQHTHFGRELARRTGAPYFEDAGLTADKRQSIVRTNEKGIIASVQANGTMRNLQQYRRNLFASIWPVGYIVEQCIGRTHRQGQRAPVVTVDWAISCREQLNGFDRVSAQHAPFYKDLLAMPSRICSGETRTEPLTQSGWAFRPNMNSKDAQ